MILFFWFVYLLVVNGWAWWCLLIFEGLFSFFFSILLYAPFFFLFFLFIFLLPLTRMKLRPFDLWLGPAASERVCREGVGFCAYKLLAYLPGVGWWVDACTNETRICLFFLLYILFLRKVRT